MACSFQGLSKIETWGTSSLMFCSVELFLNFNPFDAGSLYSILGRQVQLSCSANVEWPMFNLELVAKMNYRSSKLMT